MDITNLNDCGYHPPIISCFLNTDPAVIYNDRYNFRHPGAVYNITMLYLHKSLLDLIDKYMTNTGNVVSYYDAFRLVLYDLFKLYDSCFEIIAGYCDIASLPRAGQFVDKWLKSENIAAGEDFKNNISSEIEHLKKIHNKLKHTSNRISWLSIKVGNTGCVGYYLETYEGGTVTSADPQLFPISLNFEIRRIFYLLYRISQVLEESITKHLTNTGLNANFVIANKRDNDAIWKELFHKVDQIPKIYLPVEVNKSIPIAKIVNSELVFDQEIYTQQAHDLIYKGEIYLQAVTGGDGYSKSFSIPHMGLRPKL